MVQRKVDRCRNKNPTHRPGLRPEDEAPAGQLLSWHVSFILPSIKL